jgi:HK97 family phage prohead protease
MTKTTDKTNEIEKRYLEPELEFNDEVRSISGYAIKFNDYSVQLGDFIEKIEPRALNNVDTTDVYLLFNHDYNNVLGNTKSNTLRMQVTDQGLYFKAELPDTTLGRDTYELIKRGDLSGMSFGFRVANDNWDLSKDAIVRTIEQIKELDEISIVPRPAYPSTDVQARGADTANIVSDKCIRTKEMVLACKDCANEQKELLASAKEILNEIKQN